MFDLQKVKEQYELVKDFDTFAITTQTVKELIEKVETLTNEYETINRKLADAENQAKYNYELFAEESRSHYKTWCELQKLKGEPIE